MSDKTTIDNQKAGRKITPAKKQLILSPEFKNALAKDAKMRKAFELLTPFKQREYADHIRSGKLEKTRLSRLKKATPMICRGIGLNEKYRKSQSGSTKL